MTEATERCAPSSRLAMVYPSGIEWQGRRSSAHQNETLAPDGRPHSARAM